MANSKARIKLHHKLLHHLKRAPHHAKHFFIPHKGNDHKPHALRPLALKIYSVSIIGVKIFVSTFLFITYPSLGDFATINQSEILSLTNVARAEAGASALTLNASLNRAALLKAQDMIADNYFAHTAPDGTKPWAFLKQTGYSYSSAGENLAMDFSEASTVQTAFMNSPSHKKNILNTKYTEMGVAIVEGELQGRQTTVLVEFFAAPYTAAAVAPTPEPTPEPTPTPTPTPQPVPTYYRAELTDQSALELGIKTLEEIKFWVDFKNTGTATWRNSGQYFVALNVNNPIGRQSAFAHESWVEYYRPAVLSQAAVKPGENGRFEFTLKAPQEAGAYEESFGLVAEGLTWIDGGSIELPIVVVAPPEKSTETQVEVLPTPATQQPTNSNTNAGTNANTNTNAATSVVEEKPLASDLAPATPSPAEEAKVIVMAEKTGEQSEGFIGKMVEYAQRFYLIFVIFLIIALLLNVLIEIRIQHPHLIAQTVVVIAIAATALLFHPHFLERVPHVLQII